MARRPRVEPVKGRGGSLELTPRLRLALLAAYAASTFLAFPQPIRGRVLDLGIALAWWSPALLLLALRGLAPRRAAGRAFAAGLVAHAAILHWIYVVTVVYGHAPPVAGVLAPAALGAYIAAFTATFGGTMAWLARRRLGGPFAAALLWTALDHLRSFALTGFPWATLGYAQHRNPALLALAPYTGVYGLSFVTVLGGAAFAEGAAQLAARRRPGPGVWVALATVAGVQLAGVASLAQGPRDAPATVRVAVLQGNIDQGVKWNPSWAEHILDVYEGLSQRAAGRGAQLVVWPESAVPGWIEADGELRSRLREMPRETGATFVLGAVGVEFDGELRPVRYYDSAFVLGARGEFSDRYDKSHLVPFGEYVPLRDWLGRHFSAIARGIAPTDVSAGPGPRALSLAVSGDGSPVSAGVPICYELLFPGLVRRFVRDGAEVLLAITNDAWYGRTGAPYQFLAITALRSAETRVWTARAANTGVSAIIDARGRVRSQTRIFERGLLVEDVALRPARVGGSFYARHGDVFAITCWFGVAGLVLTGGLRGRAPRR